VSLKGVTIGIAVAFICQLALATSASPESAWVLWEHNGLLRSGDSRLATFESQDRDANPRLFVRGRHPVVSAPEKERDDYAAKRGESLR
jgi:hypothetical protein